MHLPQKLLVHAALLFTAFLWGANFSAIKELLTALEPLDVVFLRALGASGFFLIFLLVSGNPLIPMRRKDIVLLVLLGLVGITVMNLATTYGQNLLPAALASLIVTSNPVFTVIIAALLGQERISLRTVAGVIIAFTGFLIVLFLGTGQGTDFAGGQIKGAAILVIAPLSWAIYTVLSKPLLATYPPIHVAAYTVICGTMLFLTVPLWHEGTTSRIRSLDARGWFAAFFASIMAYALAYLLWYKGLKSLSPSQASIYLYLVPVFGILTAWLILDESITAWLILGGATILFGVVITNLSRTPAGSPDGSKRAGRLPDEPAIVEIVVR
ncbi:MAG: DMT family transporter [Thermomicrobiales bacterium]